VFAWTATRFLGPAILQLVVGVALAGVALAVATLVSGAVREDARFIASVVGRAVGRRGRRAPSAPGRHRPEDVQPLAAKAVPAEAVSAESTTDGT
jgi:hypothetical protein